MSEGLSSAEAARRLVEYGVNSLEQRQRYAWLAQLALRFTNPLVLLLLAAAALEIVTRDYTSSSIVLVMVLLSVGLDFVQEHRAGRAADALRRATRIHAAVVRDGSTREIPAEEVVPGDLVVLAAGDLVPADGRVLEAHDLFVNQALLTGEAFPVEKHADGIESTDPATATSVVFMGTSIISGSARYLVTTTGAKTAVGAIGTSLTRRPPPRAFELGTRKFGILILQLVVLMVLFAILVNVVRGRPSIESFMFAIALAVGLAPELLPMIVSVTLARGAIRMSAKHVLVKRLAAIHDLGSMDVLCTDKTGTLTEATIRLDQHVDVDGHDSRRVLELAYANSAFESGLRSPLDEAILRHAEVELDGWQKLDEVPFDFERRRVSVLAACGGRRLLIAKGAFEEILRLSTHVERDGAIAVLDAETRRVLVERFESFGRSGYRVLGIAWKDETPDCAHVRVSDEANLVFVGFAVFEDPPKASCPAAMSALASLGVRVVVVTGDSKEVAEHVFNTLGLPTRDVITGADIASLDDHALAARVETADLFCRLDPTQKSRVIAAFKRRGHVVGYLGDGINDAPSLHVADVGISVEEAVDVAKEAADIILLEPDLAVIRDAVVEGRRTLGNIVKYILMGTSSNFGNMFSMAGASLFLPFLPMLPTQILVNNFLYDLSEIPVPTDCVDDAFITRPHRWDMSFIRRFMIVIGPISSIFDFATFFVLYRLFAGAAEPFHTGWFVESLATQVLVIFVIRTQASPLRSRPSRALAWTSVSVVVVACVLPFSPLASILGLVPLPATFFAILIPLVATYLVVVELTKRWFYRRHAIA